MELETRMCEFQSWDVTCQALFNQRYLSTLQTSPKFELEERTLKRWQVVEEEETQAPQQSFPSNTRPPQSATVISALRYTYSSLQGLQLIRKHPLIIHTSARDHHLHKSQTAHMLLSSCGPRLCWSLPLELI